MIDRSSTKPSAVLLYDGDCGFCNATVQFVLKREKKHTLRFAALSSTFADAVLSRFPDARQLDSVFWVEWSEGELPTKIFTRSSAALRIAAYLGGPWTLLLLFSLIPKLLRDGIYGLLASNRHHIPVSSDCLRLSPDLEPRFIDHQSRVDSC